MSVASITGRGKAVSVSLKREELRVWEPEGGLGSSSLERRRGVESVRSRLSTDWSVILRSETQSPE